MSVHNSAVTMGTIYPLPPTPSNSHSYWVSRFEHIYKAVVAVTFAKEKFSISFKEIKDFTV